MRLIDADALKIAVQVGEGHNWNSYDDDERCVRKKYINNAPTVEPEITEKQAITKIINSGWLVKHDKELRDRWERPQGEWEESHIYSCGKILRMGMNVIEHKCKNCGRWSIKWERTIPDNFCSNCGAAMTHQEVQE